jgi:hypothetical protein
MLMKNNIYLALLTLSIVSFSCVTGKSQKTGKDHKKITEHHEDLSVQRIRYTEKDSVTKTTATNPVTVTPTNDITKKLDQRIDSIALTNSRYTTTSGYRILIYSGPNKSEANAASFNAYELLPQEASYNSFTSPNFRVKVGDFIDRVEAYSVLSILKQQFPNAMVVPDQVNIIKGK